MKHRYTLAALLVLAVAGAVYAGSNSERYESLVAAPTELIVNASGADSLVIGAKPLNKREILVKGNPTAYARVEFSGAALDTVVVYCNLWLKRGSTWTYLGSFQATATAGAVVDATGDNVATAVLGFDTGAATYVEFRVAAPSAGTVDVTPWVGAADSGGR